MEARILRSFIQPEYAERMALCWKRFVISQTKPQEKSWLFGGEVKNRI